MGARKQGGGMETEITRGGTVEERYQEPVLIPGGIRLTQRGRVTTNHAGMGAHEEVTGLVARVLRTYNRVDTPGTNERASAGSKGSGAGVYIRGRSGAGVNGEAAALEEILLNDGNIGGTGKDGLLGSALGLKPEKLAAVRVMGTNN